MSRRRVTAMKKAWLLKGVCIRQTGKGTFNEGEAITKNGCALFMLKMGGA